MEDGRLRDGGRKMEDVEVLIHSASSRRRKVSTFHQAEDKGYPEDIK